MSITVVFDTPKPSDTPTVFNIKAFQALADWNEWTVEANALALAVNANKLAAAASEAGAASSAATSTTKAAEALASKNAAELAETNAEAAQAAAASSAIASAASEASAALSASTATTKAAEALASKNAAELAETNAEAAQAASSASQAAALVSQNAAAASELASSGYSATAVSKAAEALASKNAAELAETNAEAAQSAAAISASSSAGSASEANTEKLASEAARDKAQQWADAALNVPVEAGQYSAKHWAQQAQATVTGQLVYRGGHDASTGSYPASPFKGDYWKIAVGGTVSGVVLAAGDSIIYNGTSWDKIDSTDQVSSVAGRTGDVVLGKGDVGLGNVDNTSDADKPVSTAQQTALNAKAPLTGGGTSGTWPISVSGSAGSSPILSTEGISNVNVNYGNSRVLRTDTGTGAAYTYAPILHMAASDTMWQMSVNHGTGNGTMAFRQGYSGSWGSWLTVLSSANYNNYAPTLTGGGASGTWGISVTGNAGTAYGLNVHAGRNNEANKVVRTDGNGYLQTGYINCSNGNENNASSPPRVWGTNGGDDYMRTYQTASLSVGSATNSRYIYDNGAYSGAAAYREASSMHVYYAQLGRTVYNNGAYSGSGWVEPSELGVRYALSSTNSSYAQRSGAGWFYYDQNYGHSAVGAYASTRYQGVYAMGDSYKLPADGTTTGNLYGLAWAHPNAGGAAGNLDSHGLLVLINGGFASAISYSIVASGNVTAYSDERLKTNWRAMPEDYVSRLAKVKVGIYDRIDAAESNRLAAEAAEPPGDELVMDAGPVVPIPVTQVGVGAQSLRELLPEAVNQARDEMGTLSVSYGNAALASCVELAKELVSLRNELNQLKTLLKGA